MLGNVIFPTPTVCRRQEMGTSPAVPAEDTAPAASATTTTTATTTATPAAPAAPAIRRPNLQMEVCCLVLLFGTVVWHCGLRHDWVLLVSIVLYCLYCFVLFCFVLFGIVWYFLVLFGTVDTVGTVVL